MPDLDPSQNPILQSLGRIEGMLAAALGRIDGHDADIDELRRDQAAMNQLIAANKAEAARDNSATRAETAAIRTTLRAIYGCLGFLAVVIATLAGVFQAVHGG